ncbi:uncharacterized protein LOC106639307 [Copidosoma floridanum]|uniref:uncharacterized protein LOC106639307 n=1 Tax=Copidosoma floridanum TaxID=29053 RepID=UPI0006C98F6E|nr:uncharacterized protein LOC106639307 [Copidosoma floridanum]
MKLKKILETSFQLQPKEANQKLEIYKCKHCGQTYARHITRMSIHLLKCSGCPAAVKELLKEKVKGKILETSKNVFNKKGQVRNLKKILDENFAQVPRDGSQKLDIYKCKHCEQKYARNASRMSLHLQKCSDCPKEVKTALELNAKEGMAHKVSRQLIPKKLLDNSFIMQPKEPNQKLQTFKCKYCGQVYARHSTRMSLHLQKCIGCPTTVKQSLTEKNKHWKEHKFVEVNFKRHDSENEQMPSDRDMGVIQISSTNTYSNNKISESNFIGKMSKQRQKYCEELLAKAIYASSVPVNIVDNEHWRTLLNTLSPAFQLPTQEQLSTNLLEATYESVKKVVDQKVRDAISIGLQCSYRTNSKNESIIHFVLTTPDPVLYRSISISNNEEDAQLYMEKISEVIEEVGPERVLGVCLDSVSTCENLWDLMQQKYEEYNISFYYCISQTLNLLLKEISELPSISILLKQALTMIKEIRHSEVMSTLLNEVQKNDEKALNNFVLKIPGTKKWSSYLVCLDSLLDHKDDLQVLVFSSKTEKYVSKVTKELISDEEFWNKILSYTKLVRPIIKWINNLDSQEAKICEVTEIIRELDQHLIAETSQESLTLVTTEEANQILNQCKTLSVSLVQDIHYAANILNPIFKGVRLTAAELSQGQDLITKLSSKFGMPEKDIMIDLAEFNADSGVWSVNYVKRSATLMPPSTWWRGLFKNSFLTKIAASILDLPSTSLVTTEKFSMRDDPTGKIMYISQNLRLLDPHRNEKKANQDEASADTVEEYVEEEDIYTEGMEEVLVEDHDESMEETEEVVEAHEISEEDQEQTGSPVFLEIIDEEGKAFLVEQVPQNVTI